MSDLIRDFLLKVFIWFETTKSDFIKDEEGNVAEYVLMIAVIVFGIVATATVMMDPLETLFKEIVAKISKLALGK